MTTNNDSPDPQSPGSVENRAHPPIREDSPAWHSIRNRLLEGLLVILPMLITFWIIYWMYSTLEKYVIDPLAGFVLWKGRLVQSATELPHWFETYAAPIIAIILALAIVYCCGILAHSRLRRLIDRILLRVPIVSQIYEGVRGIMQCLDKPAGQPSAQRVVLVSFPHPGMRLPAIVTSAIRDVATEKKLLCVYVPTTPIPTSGFFLVVPEEEVTELNWGVQQTLQAIISGGLTAPPEISYYKSKPSIIPVAPPIVGPVPPPSGSGNS